MIEKFAEAIIEVLPDALYAINQNGEIVIWNKAIEKLTGVKKENVLGKGNYEYSYIFYGERVPGLVDTLLDKTGEVEKTYKNFVRHENTVTGEKKLKNQNKILMGWASLLYDRDGNSIIGEVIVIKDITRETENEINFLKIFDESPEPIAITDYDTGEIINVNKAFEHFIGYTLEELRENKLKAFDCVVNYTRDDFNILLKTHQKLEHIEIDVRKGTGDMAFGVLSSSVASVEERKRVITIIRDITQQINLKNYLKIIQKESEKKIDEYVTNQNAIFNDMMLKHNKEIKDSLVISQNIIKDLELKFTNGEKYIDA